MTSFYKSVDIYIYSCIHTYIYRQVLFTMVNDQCHLIFPQTFFAWKGPGRDLPAPGGCRRCAGAGALKGGTLKQNQRKTVGNGG